MAVIAPEASKATTLTPDGEVAYFSIPIEKQEDTEAVNPVDGTPDIMLWGKATDGTLDNDLQIVDPAWSEKALADWLANGPALRVMHQPKRDPAGTGIDVQGHHIKALVSEPAAKHLVRTGALRDFSVGMVNIDVRVGDPRFKHLDPQGKAVNGVVTGRQDGLSQIIEVSLCDRGSNRGSRFAMVKAAGDGTPEWVGEMVRDGGPVPAREDGAGSKGVTVTLPKSLRVSVSPKDLAKLATFKQGLVAQRPAAPPVAGTALAAEASAAAAVPAAAPPDDGALAAVKAAEAEIYKRDIDTATRRRLAGEGRALPNLSYPVETHEDAGNAVTLIVSGHGDTGAAKKMLRRIARKEGWQDILDRLKGKTAAAVAVTAVARPGTAKKKGKFRAVCPGCGAKQNPEHAHCPECGAKLPAGAVTVAKNHDFVCLGCGKSLDKGERFCPQCGKENPGYLPEADKKIPANVDAGKSGKARVAKGKKGKGGKPTPGDGVTGTAARDQKPAARHREPDGAEVEALERDAHLEDGDDEKPNRLEAGTLKSAKAGGKKTAGKKGKKGGKGKKKLPPWMEDKDGGENDAAKSAYPDGFSDPEVQAALRLKTIGVPLRLGITHDLVCPAYAPAEVRLCYPQASLKTLDLAEWQARAGDDSLPLTEARKGLDLWNAALALKNADPADVDDIRNGLHKAFRSVNLDAQPGPGTFPTPTQISAAHFRRPLISEGHEAPSPGHDAPHHAQIPPAGGIAASDFRRPFISAGHADDSPSNTHPAAPMPAPDRTGDVTQGPARTFYRNSSRDAASHAMQVLHDHIAAYHPGLCPMHGAAEKPVPTPEGVPATAAAPGPKGAAKSAEDIARARAKAARRKAARAGKRKAAKIRRKARDRRHAIEAKVLKGKMTLEQGRAELGLEPFTEGILAKAALAAGGTEAGPAAALTPEDVTRAVAKATKPLVKKIGRQGRALRKVRRTADAIANQADTSAAPFRGVAVAKSASASPAGALSVAEPVAQAHARRYADLYETWRTSPDPVAQEAAWSALRPYWDPTMTPPQT